MKIVSDFPYDIVEEENVWIPVTDGLKLAARIWRPAGSEQQPVPAVLEYIPYRKRFGTTHRDEITHKYLAGHGYACVRLDIRGSGESEGVLTDEYLQSELDDGVAAVHWLAAQDWCDGNVGMMGISWGGFNALQIAAMQPDPLKAIISVSSSDDRYADDIHHMGGTLLGDNLSWASVMFSFNTLPPDPVLVGPRWRDMWMQRLEGSGLWLKTWLAHQRRDAYWRHGSICEDYSKVKTPCLAVSGWADGYTNTVFRLIENLDGPHKGLVGPWGHTYPHIGRPGPAIDFLTQVLRWWDRWLKGKDTGVEEDPAIRVWMQDSAPPNPQQRLRSGYWAAEQGWPSARIEPRRYQIDIGRHLVPEGQAEPDHPLDVQSPVTLGLFAGKWCSYAKGPDLAGDQRRDDGGSLVFQTEPLEEPLEILGAPVVELDLASDQPVAMVAVRLSDMRPDHQVTRVTYGLLNLTHRTSQQHPERLVPGERVRVRVAMNYIGQRFPAGHRIRLAISNVYWPLAWTPPEPTRLRIWTNASRLILPVRPPSRADAALPDLGQPVGAAGPRATLLQPERHRWLVNHDLGEQRSELVVTDDRGEVHFDDIGLTAGARAEEVYSAVTGDFASVVGKTQWERWLQREAWSVRTLTRTRLRSDAKNFYLDAQLDAYESDARLIAKSWREVIPRDLI
ncbi:MAG: CocE/NonD family hydrolase [Rhodothalassiaceae bacterium]